MIEIEHAFILFTIDLSDSLTNVSWKDMEA